MLLFCHDLLQYPLCPSYLPIIQIDPNQDADGRIEFGFFTTITLREWDASAYWQSVLVHEITHHVQHFNGETFTDTRKTEREALSAQVAWLIKIRAPPEAFPSEQIIKRLAG
jgi:hypothetical protein